MIPAQYYYALRMWWAVPLITAMLVLMFAMGATAGAADRYPEDPRVVDEFTTGMENVTVEQAQEEALEDYGSTGANRAASTIAVAIWTPMVGAMKWAAIEGYWFGLANPSVGDWIFEAANLFALLVVAAYIYAIYRGLKRAGKWLW